MQIHLKIFLSFLFLPQIKINTFDYSFHEATTVHTAAKHLNLTIALGTGSMALLYQLARKPIHSALHVSTLTALNGAWINHKKLHSLLNKEK